MALIQELAQGVAGAMSPAVAQENAKKRSDRRATSQEEVHAQAQSILNNVKGVQDKIAALGPNPDPKQLGTYQAQLHTLRQDWTDLFHPVKNPGNLGMMGKVLQAFRGQQGPTALTADRMAQGDIAGAPVAKPAQAANPEADYVKNLEAAGFSHDDAMKAARVKAGLDARATEKKPKTMATIEPDSESPTGYSKVVKDQVTGDELSRERNVLPPRGFVPSSTDTNTTDPFGVQTHSQTVRKPILPGTPGSQAGSGGSMAPKKPGEQKRELEQKVSKTGGTLQVDPEGHIPADAKVNPGLRQAANQLLDGADITKMAIPEKDREAASALAEKYGYKGQGLFTPKDQLLLRESETYLNQAMKDPSMKVLDSAKSRVKLMNALNDKPGLASDILASTWKLSDDEANFLSMYRQLTGTISGLGQLTRANKTTEAGIKRLMAELPNPREVQSSDQAVTRLKRLQSELTVARQKGYIPNSAEGDGGTSSGPIVVTPEDMK